ncbi:MAG TPA: restriction endonuclease [Polyangiaceae bacterium]|nr:restriction endonuclease [Polyangiaceae bacterium]
MTDAADVEALLGRERIPAAELRNAIAAGQRGGGEGFVQKVRGALERRFASLEKPPPSLSEQALTAWKQGRGYRLEELLVGLMALEGLRPEPAYRTRSEQIDALFELRGRHFLLEAKWTSDAQSVSALYELWCKVDGKLAGTLGVFVSMNGFSEDAAKSLTVGKTVRVILVDGTDVRSAFSGEVQWAELIDLKCRMAAQRGIVYYSWKQKKDLENA